MLKINGKGFYVATTLLEAGRTRFQNADEDAVVHEDDRSGLKRDLESLISQLELLGTRVTKIAAARLLKNLDNPETTYGQVVQQYDHLDWRLLDELSGVHLFVLPEYLRAYFEPAEPLFGKGVAEKFAAANEEIDEAGKCFALRRSTACVFHLMRVMELGVQRLGSKMKIAINPKTETWYQIMQHVDNAIKAMPVKSALQKTRKARYAATAAHLDGVRIAWRNDVMHPKATYTEDQAKEVFDSVKLFIRDLVGLT